LDFAAGEGGPDSANYFPIYLFGSRDMMTVSDCTGADMQQEPTTTRAIRLVDVMRLTGASRPTIWRWSKSDPTFPRPFRLSAAITCWDEGEVIAWIERKKDARR
jgi:predicted DNA-binding transcriptional regulator AlpA